MCHEIREGAKVDGIVLVNDTNYMYADTVFLVCSKEKMAPREEAMRVVNAHHTDGGLHTPGKFQGAGVQWAEPAICAACAFWKDENIAASGQQARYFFHLLKHKGCKFALRA